MHDIEKQIILKGIDIFDNDEYIDECNLSFVVNRAVEAIIDSPSRIEKIIEKIKKNFSSNRLEVLNEFDKYREEIFQYLGNENFLVNKNNEKLLYYFPHLYLISLENNYQYTINYPAYHYLPSFDLYPNIIIKDEVISDRYYRVLTQNKYSLKDNVNHPFFVAPIMFMASLETDKRLTCAEGEQFFKSFSIDAKKYIYKNSFVESYKGKEGLLPQFIVENSFVLEDLLKNTKKVELATKILSTYSYDSFDEKEVLSVFGVEKSSIEEFVRELCCGKLLKTKNTLSLEEKILFTFYAKKILEEKGVPNAKVNLFSYSTIVMDGKELQGRVVGNEVFMFITQKDTSMQSFLLNLFHEISHLKQNRDSKFVDYVSDRDIDLYYKDYILSFIHDGYYGKNYSNISYEVDASFKAQIKLYKELKQLDKLYMIYKVKGEKELFDNEKFLNDMERYSQIYSHSYRTVGGENIPLDLLFEMSMNRYMSGGGSIEEYCDRFPLFKYEYLITDNGVKRKTISQLVESIKNDAKNNKDKGIYLYLIEQSLDSMKNVSFKENTEELKMIIAKESGELKEELIKISNDKNLQKSQYPRFKNI